MSLAVTNASAAALSAGKKAGQVQLQAELTSDEEWEKFLQREGLLVVDVYSEWCGPCLGMVGNLKKLKVEVGGDNLHLAVARSDSIDCLKRFRNKSEPTWMFLAGGRLLNVLGGADAPRLTRLILEELSREEEVRRGERQRPDTLPHELTPHEEALAAETARAAEARRVREAAAAAAARAARRKARADLLEPYVRDACPLLLWPHAHKHLKRLSELLEPLGITVADKYPLLLSGEQQAALWEGVEGEEHEALRAAAGPLSERPALAVLLRRAPSDPSQGDFAELIHRVLCEERRGPEGSEGRTAEEEARGECGRGLYAPRDRLQRAAAVDVLYSKLVSSAVEPPAPATPPHVAVLLGAWQRRAALAACSLHARDALHVGFFASADLHAPVNIAKDLAQYEQRPEKDYGDTLAIMVARRGSEEGDALLRALTSLGALHVSEDTVEGAEECARLFPPGYGAPDPKPQPKVKKKKSKKRMESGKETTEAAATEPAAAGAAEGGAEAAAAGAAEGGEGGDAGEGEEAGGEEAGGEEEEEEPQEEASAEDKATSPIPDAAA